MANLTESQLGLIKRYVSHPSGSGYVADFSNQTFSTWFRDTWNVDIYEPRYESEGTSKGNRLISFCRQSDDTTVYRVLNSLRQRAYDLDIEKSEIVMLRDVKAFNELLEAIAERLSNDTHDESFDNLEFKNITRDQLISRAKSNEVSLLFVGTVALENLENFREAVRSDNYCAVENPEVHNELLKLIDELIGQIEKLLKNLPSASGATTEKDCDELVGWTQRYINGALPKLQEYIAPEKLGAISVPVGVIFSCGAVGSLLTGFNPIGFAAGSMVGKFIVGEMKSGAAADQITERLEIGE